jgi:hypothetical protein
MTARGISGLRIDERIVNMRLLNASSRSARGAMDLRLCGTETREAHAAAKSKQI